jgi:hypothetical protein
MANLAGSSHLCVVLVTTGDPTALLLTSRWNVFRVCTLLDSAGLDAEESQLMLSDCAINARQLICRLRVRVFL